MLKKFFAFGVLGAATFGLLALPAQADTAVIQESDNYTIIDGTNNSVQQSASQESRTRTTSSLRHKSRSNNAVIQESVGTAEVYGRGNEVYQEQTQTSVIEEVEEQRSRRGRGRGRRYYED